MDTSANQLSTSDAATARRVCLVTGTSGSIGRLAASALAARGHTVFAGMRDRDGRNRESCWELERRCEVVELDVTDGESVRTAVDTVMERTGRIDVLVNNAALVEFAPMEAVSIDRVEAMLDVNVLGPLRMLQSAAPAMRAGGGGTVIQVSSVSGRVVSPLAGAYAASKHALEAWSEAAWQELGHFGVRVVVVEPGDVGSVVLEPPSDDGLGYRPLWEQVFRDRGRGGGGRPTSADVAAAISRIAEDPAQLPFRVQVGADAETVVAMRPTMSDEDFRDAVWAMLELDW